MKRVALVGYAGFNELDIFAPLYIINCVLRGQEAPYVAQAMAAIQHSS